MESQGARPTCGVSWAEEETVFVYLVRTENNFTLIQLHPQPSIVFNTLMFQCKSSTDSLKCCKSTVISFTVLIGWVVAHSLVGVLFPGTSGEIKLDDGSHF